MKMRQATATLVTLISLSAPAFGNGWALLDQVEVREVIKGDDWRVEKTFPAELETASEAPFAIEGYLIPVTAEAEFRHLLLVRDPDECPFCGDSYGPALEVELDRPVRNVEEFAFVTVRGNLELVDDPMTTQTVRLTGAELIAR